MVEFDKYGKCEKCGGCVRRLKRSKTWHHVEQSDYIRCGYVKINREDDNGKT